jgi:hypothetical protein
VNQCHELCLGISACSLRKRTVLGIEVFSLDHFRHHPRVSMFVHYVSAHLPFLCICQVTSRYLSIRKTLLEIIQDCLAWSFEYLHLCHRSKNEIVVLKLNFEKAFDKIEHKVILKILAYKGFGTKWRSGIESILNSGTSVVLLNSLWKNFSLEERCQTR